VVIASLFWKLKSKAVFLSMASGFGAFLILFVLGNLSPDTAAITLPAAIIGLILGQIVFKVTPFTSR
jgi:putative effector of murein hydrolase LrgA (UPF0299 family)